MCVRISYYLWIFAEYPTAREISFSLFSIRKCITHHRISRDRGSQQAERLIALLVGCTSVFCERLSDFYLRINSVLYIIYTPIFLLSSTLKSPMDVRIFNWKILSKNICEFMKFDVNLHLN